MIEDLKARSATPCTSVRSLDGRDLLFSEPRQAIFELDERSVGLWDQLQCGVEPADIVSALPDVTSEERCGVTEALQQLRSISEEGCDVLPTNRRIPARSARSKGLVLELAQVAFELDLTADLHEQVEAELGHLKSAATEVQARIVGRENDHGIEVAAGERTWSCAPSEFMPLLKGELLDEVLRSAVYEVALHAAALVHDDRLVLLCGSPGAGKTTLAIALTKAGFGLAADDVLLLDDDGFGTGLPFPFAAKSPSWPLVETFYPGRRDQAHVRPDGQVVRYFLPESYAVSALPRPIDHVLFLDRRPGEGATLSDVSPVDALGGLIAEGSARNERLSTAGFEALVEMLNHARCRMLTYADLGDAVKAVTDSVA